MNSTKLLAVAASLMLVVALAFPALGAKYTWSDSGVEDNNWTNAARWTGGPSSFPNAAGDVAFSWSNIVGWRHLFLNQDVTIGSLSWYGGQLYVEPGTPAGRFIVSDGGVPTVWSNQIHYGFTINAGIVLDSDLRLWHYGDAWDSWEAYLNGQITSTGKLTVTHSMSPGLNRAFVIGGTVSNTYSGGTVLDAGSIAGSIFRAGKNGAFGLGDVTVSDDAVLDLTDKGATDDMIYNAAALRLNQSSTSRSTVRLASGVNESVRALYINDVQYDSGTYGSHASAATKFINRTLDRFFTNTGVLTVLESGGAAGYIQCTNTVLAFSGVSSCVMGGTNNMYIAGDLRWTNETTRTWGAMTPTDGSWEFTVDLAIGVNKVTVSGTNSVGAICEDSVTVLLTSPPAITNEAPKDVLVTSAKACGNLTATNFAPTTVKLYYGTNDGGTAFTSWDTEVDLGILPQGRIEYLITNLTGVTYYRYYATNASGEAWCDVTTTITPKTPFDPAGYANVLTITFSGYSGATTLTNFPAMVKLDTGIANFSYGDFLSGSNDIRFVDTATNELNYEIDTWNTVGSSYLWVQMPELKTNTQIKMYYSKADVTAPSYRTDGSVWSENYALVQHMGDDNANPIADSTANGNTGIRDLTARADAKIGGGQQFDLGDSIRVTNNATIQNRKISLQVWVKYSHAACNPWARFFDKVWDSSFSLNRQNNTDRAQTDMRTDTGVGLSIASTVATGDNAWHLIHATKGASTMKLYVDGVEQGNVNNTVDLRINNNDLYIGHNGGGGECFTGLMDEARVSSVQRSADWIKAEYVGQNAPQSFGSYAVASLVADAPYVDITNLAGQVIVNTEVTSYTFMGTNSEYTVGDITWNNSLGGSGVVPAANTGWTFTVSLGTGDNVIAVTGTNMTGIASQDSVTVVVPYVLVTNEAASGIWSTIGTANGSLYNASPTTPTAVWLYWGKNDGGVDAAAWSNVVFLGANVASGHLATYLNGLSQDTTYYYAYCATNVLGTFWAADGSASFTTTNAPGGSWYIWNQGGGSFNWNEAANWTGGMGPYPNAPGDVAYSWVNGAGKTISLNQDTTIGSMHWNVGSLVIAPGTPAGRLIVNDGGVPITWTNQIHYGCVINCNMRLDSDARIIYFADYYDSTGCQLNGQISSTGKLAITYSGPANNPFIFGGTAGSNTYAGGTEIGIGQLGQFQTQFSFFRADKNGAFGLGDVWLTTTNALLELTDRGATDDMIYDGASVYLTSEGPLSAKLRLNAGVNETVRSLYVNGSPCDPGTWGSSASAAANKNDNWFTNTGILTVLEGGTASSVLDLQAGRGAAYGQVQLSWSNGTIIVLACTNRYYPANPADPANWFVLAPGVTSPWTHVAATNFASVYYRIISGAYTSQYDVGKFDVDIAAGSISWLSFPFAPQPACDYLSEWFGQQLLARDYSTYAYPLLQVQNGLGGPIITRSYYVDTFGEATTNWFPSDDPIVQNAGYVLFLAPDQAAVKLTSLGMVPTNDVTLEVPYQTIPWVGLSYPSSVDMRDSGITNLFNPPQQYSLFNYDFVDSQETLGGSVWYAEYFIDDWGGGTTNFFIDVTGADRIDGGKGYLLFFSTTRTETGTWTWVRPY